MKKSLFYQTFFVYLRRMEKEIPGFDNYKVVIDNEGVRCINVSRGKPICNKVVCNKIIWGLRKNGECHNTDAGRLIERMFPEVDKKMWLFHLYEGVKNKTRQKAKMKIAPGITLLSLYSPSSYCLQMPLDMDVEKQIKRAFPASPVIINVEEGNEIKRWREIYFKADMCLLCVGEIIKDFLDNC